jgi:hypothetical protein
MTAIRRNFPGWSWHVHILFGISAYYYGGFPSIKPTPPNAKRYAKFSVQNDLQKVHPRGLEPLTFGSVGACSNDLKPGCTNDLRHCLEAVVSSLGTTASEVTAAAADDLCVVLRAWPTLPADLRKAIVRMVGPWAESISGDGITSPLENGDVK